MNDSSSCFEFHSHFSKDNIQDASTINAHMIRMVDNARQTNQDVSECTILESTDGCLKQYRFGVALYFFIICKY